MHSTRFAGKGENFWQFKEYSHGESIMNIDGEKSASSNKVLIKQNEKELSKTIYLYFDRSYSRIIKVKILAIISFFFCTLSINTV